MDARNMFMSGENEPISTELTACDSVPLRVYQALFELLQDYIYATDLSDDVWQFATTIERLWRLGISNNDLRWLLAKGWLKHAYETHPTQLSVQHPNRRSFQQARIRDISPQSCFVLSTEGVAFARQASERYSPLGPLPAESVLKLDSAAPATATATKTTEEPLPRWDGERNHLYLGERLIKEFRLPSPNQTTILMAFEEEHWPPRIDDPLPATEAEPKQRLRYTIKSLNKHQRVKAIQFSGDGSGQGILWEPVWAPQADSPPLPTSTWH